MFLSREKRNEFDIFKDYFEMYNPSRFKQFYYSKKYRCYFNPKVYPVFKRDIHHFFKDKDYYPESHLKNPKKEGVWYVKPNEGANGEGIIITDDVRSVDMKNAVYQKSIDNPLLYNGRKQDFRMFVVLQTYQGYLRTYIFFEHFVRLSPLPYDEKDLRREVQLTNQDSYWIDYYNTLIPNPKYSEDIMKSGLIPFTQHPHRDKLYKDFVDMMIDFSEDVYNKLNKKTQRNLIHVFGIDVLPDKDMKLWMLETNNNPHPTAIDDKRLDIYSDWPQPYADMSYAKTLIESAIHELIYPMENDSEVKLDKFEMVYEKELSFNKWIFV
jgi:hypothetical protein